MFVTIINDCRDENAQGRQVTRAAALFSAPVSFVGVSSDLEVAGNLVDILDAAEGKPGVVLVNVAPRSGISRKWGNGSPFGYFRYQKTVVLASIEGKTLSLVKKLGIVDALTVLDVSSSVALMRQKEILTSATARQVTDTQFRSFDFLPRAAQFLLTGANLPGRSVPISETVDPDPAIWWIDNFGNCKTTLLPADITADDRGMLKITIGMLPFIPQLKDVPDGTTACVIGSSGIDAERFLEIVRQGGSAAEEHALSVGTVLFERS